MSRVIFCRLLMIAAMASTAWGCNLPPSPPYPEKARQSLVTFFDLLSQGDYAQAAEFYGGDYSQLQVYGPGLDPADRAGLWQNACETSGLQCLPVGTVTYLGSAGATFTFVVEFRKPDGNVFAIAPCCGEPGFLDPPMTDFVYRVARTSTGKFVVLDLPAYVP